MWFKMCPRCHGDLIIQVDIFGRMITCVQCGFSKDVGVKPVALVMGPREMRKTHGGRTSNSGVDKYTRKTGCL